MRNFWALFKYEAHRLIVSPSTYVIALIFSLSICAIFMLLLSGYSMEEQSVPFAQMFFRCFFLPTIVIVPLISMGSFSEEYKNGIFQSLFSVAVSQAEVVLAKFVSAYLMFMILWLSSLFLFLAVGMESKTILREAAFAMKFNISGGLLLIGLVGTFFISIGILSSSLTENQIISCMVTFFILMTLFIGGEALADNSRISNLNLFGTYSESLKIFSQVDNFCNGIVDSRTVVFYLSSSVLALCASVIAVQRKIK
ncbi:MAG: ABC transporter permease [Puniceicoccales bacterium]|jgi:ABC-2 type transport system permease protein|nr:ABC transporter permease [Puniceicoccales bacterium]